MRDIFINKLLIEMISQYCEQLVCLHFDCPKSESKTPQIAKLLSDKIQVEINFGYDLSEDSIIALLQNMPQIKDIRFYSYSLNRNSIRELIPYFGRNIRSLSMSRCSGLGIEDLIAIKCNTNLV
jgi:hypothetical protein